MAAATTETKKAVKQQNQDFVCKCYMFKIKFKRY